YRRPIDPATWQAAVGDWCRRNGQADIHAPLIETVERILRYEARLTADGVLPYGAVIRDMIAYDFGRAVNFARWGVHAEYTDPATAESFILHAGVQSRRFYSSWAHLSAGYILGRCLQIGRASCRERVYISVGRVAGHIAVKLMGSTKRQ